LSLVMLDNHELSRRRYLEITNPKSNSASKMSLRYGVGSATTALAVVGACKMRISRLKD
jgi:hypothetical protein